MERYWHGSTVCDFCQEEIKSVLIDGRTQLGPWATMCEQDWREHGCGQLGTGSGQKYEERDIGFVKVEG